VKRVLIAAHNDTEAYAQRFRTELPGHVILTRLPDDGEPVHYAVVGWPESGLLARMSGLELILSVNAGIEHLLASGEVPPHVPVVRLVDSGLAEGMVEWVAAQVDPVAGKAGP
jgi:glyoxylate/hydroxypyruvate reductase A